MTIKELCDKINEKYDRKVCWLARDYFLEQHKYDIEEFNKEQEEKNKICDWAWEHNISYEAAQELLAKLYY